MEHRDTHAKKAQLEPLEPYRLTMQLVVPTREERARGATPHIELTSNNAALSKNKPGLPRGFAARKDERKDTIFSFVRRLRSKLRFCERSEAIQANAASPRTN